MELVKYKNRKFYSNELGRYVNLDEIGLYIRNGHEVTATEYETGEDITSEVRLKATLSDKVLHKKISKFIETECVARRETN